MDEIMITSLLLSEDSLRDNNGKIIIIGPLPDISFKVLPNNFSFSINFALLNLKPNVPYNLEISMIQSDKKKIVESKLEGITLNAPNNESHANSYINVGVKNQEFTCFGECKVIVSIEEASNPNNNDQMTLVVPILQRR